MSIDWSKLINKEVVVNCKTEDEAVELLKAFEGNNVRRNECTYWESFGDQTCYRFYNKFWRCESCNYFKLGAYTVVTYQDLIKQSNKPKVAEILGFEIGDEYEIEDYDFNPCIVSEEYTLLDKDKDMISPFRLINMINGKQAYKKIETRKMTIAEIEKVLGHRVEVVEG